MISYSIYKNTSSDQWVTFVHGAGGSSSIWFKQIRDFKKYFNILLLDLRGHGKSNFNISRNAIIAPKIVKTVHINFDISPNSSIRSDLDCKKPYSSSPSLIDKWINLTPGIK